MHQSLQFNHSILQSLPSLRPGQQQMLYTLHNHAESSMLYVALQGRVAQGARWVPDLMRMHVEHCLHAGHPEQQTLSNNSIVRAKLELLQEDH